MDKNINGRTNKLVTMFSVLALSIGSNQAIADTKDEVEDRLTTQDSALVVEEANVVPLNAKIIPLDDGAEIAVWKDGENMYYKIVSFAKEGGTDNIIFSTEVNGQKYQFYVGDDFEFLAQKI